MIEQLPTSEAANDALRHELDNLRALVQQNDAEIDTIQIALNRNTRPWWLEPPVLVSVLAALVAILSTAYGIYQQREQERHSARVELRELIGQLKDNAELRIKYGAAGAQQLGGYIDSENQLLADQAEDILNTYGADVSSTEFILVGLIFTTSGDFSRAQNLLHAATQRAETPYEYVFAYRALAQAEFTSGNFDRGREAYQQAMNVRKRFTDLPESIYDGFDAQTLIYLGGSEIAIQECERARAALDQAEATASEIPDLNSRTAFLTQVVNYRVSATNCQLMPVPVLPTTTP